MHWHAPELVAVLLGVAGAVVLAFAFCTRLEAGDRTLAALSGGTGLAWTGFSALDDAATHLPPYTLVIPTLIVLWLIGGLRRPGVAPAGRPAEYYAFEVLDSPALWEALPPPPVSPAVGLPISAAPISTAPRFPGVRPERAQLAPPELSLFEPAIPGRAVVHAEPEPAPAPEPEPEPQVAPAQRITAAYRLRNLRGEF